MTYVDLHKQMVKTYFTFNLFIYFHSQVNRDGDEIDFRPINHRDVSLHSIKI